MGYDHDHGRGVGRGPGTWNIYIYIHTHYCLVLFLSFSRIYKYFKSHDFFPAPGPSQGCNKSHSCLKKIAPWGPTLKPVETEGFSGASQPGLVI